MRSEQLGTSGPRISRLGIGGWQAGGPGPWGGGPSSDDDQSIAAIRRAVELGVTWVETAASYGLGHSEEVVARALRPWRIGEDVFVFTKCGHPWDPPDRIRTDLSPDSIRRECEGSLRRLDVERIDLYQFHHRDPSTSVEQSWETMAELVKEGKVRWAGVSNFDVDLLERCEAIRHVDCLQPELSLLRPSAREDVIPWAVDHGTGVVVYSPMGSGLLSGAYDRERLQALPADDRRYAPSDQLVRQLEHVHRLAGGIGLAPGLLAVAWTLSVQGVTGAICGARRPEHVDGWIRAAEVELDAGIIVEIESILITGQ